MGPGHIGIDTERMCGELRGALGREVAALEGQRPEDASGDQDPDEHPDMSRPGLRIGRDHDAGSVLAPMAAACEGETIAIDQREARSVDEYR
jgi:hypothetical protein